MQNGDRNKRREAHSRPQSLRFFWSPTRQRHSSTGDENQGSAKPGHSTFLRPASHFIESLEEEIVSVLLGFDWAIRFGKEVAYFYQKVKEI